VLGGVANDTDTGEWFVSEEGRVEVSDDAGSFSETD
jgi:hypothetical protein